MAQKVNIILVDDLDESEADETVTFGLDGVTYEIDLNDKHATSLRQSLTKYVDHARRVKGSSRRKAASNGAGGTPPKEIRQWARDEGIDIPDRGRVPQEVKDRYSAAH